MNTTTEHPKSTTPAPHSSSPPQRPAGVPDNNYYLPPRVLRAAPPDDDDDGAPAPAPDEPTIRRPGSVPVKSLSRTQAALLSELLKLHQEVLGAAKKTLKQAIRIGEILVGFKDTVGYGNWLRWLEENVPFTDRTARNYMRVFEHRTVLESETISDLTEAYRLLAEPMDATENQAATEATTESTDTSEEKESTKETESRPARKANGKSAKGKRERAKKFKALRDSVPAEWIETIDQAINDMVGGYATACKNGAAHMLVVADVLRKCAARIEEDIAAQEPARLPEAASQSKLSVRQKSKLQGTVGHGKAKESLDQFLTKLNPVHLPTIEAALNSA